MTAIGESERRFIRSNATNIHYEIILDNGDNTYTCVGQGQHSIRFVKTTSWPVVGLAEAVAAKMAGAKVYTRE